MQKKSPSYIFRLMKYLGLAFLIIGAFLIGTVFSSPSCGAACDPGIRSESPARFREYLKTNPGTLIDIRTDQEYSAGHLESAVNVDYYQTQAFSDYLDRLDKNDPYYIYCRTGNRSGNALKIMQEKGFTRVTDLSGGIAAWESAGLPLTR